MGCNSSKTKIVEVHGAGHDDESPTKSDSLARQTSLDHPSEEADDCPLLPGEAAFTSEPSTVVASVAGSGPDREVPSRPYTPEERATARLLAHGTSRPTSASMASMRGASPPEPVMLASACPLRPSAFSADGDGPPSRGTSRWRPGRSPSPARLQNLVVQRSPLGPVTPKRPALPPLEASGPLAAGKGGAFAPGAAAVCLNGLNGLGGFNVDARSLALASTKLSTPRSRIVRGDKQASTAFALDGDQDLVNFDDQHEQFEDKAIMDELGMFITDMNQLLLAGEKTCLQETAGGLDGAWRQPDLLDDQAEEDPDLLIMEIMRPLAA
eukprot:TRINITY_DN123037_c0_g1_i1.p1 TRINITY_DN123037_c0_g1~~TRINITY_DN123037_c0_g1_i1.p1  ORF type:complete len:349 (+),score=61.72 TRINITY_DN123037_c0_g1_i1:74-1048(+)